VRKFLTLVNGFAVLFSIVWLIGHATVRIGDWEFWFAVGYLLVVALNLGYVVGWIGKPTDERDR